MAVVIVLGVATGAFIWFMIIRESVASLVPDQLQFTFVLDPSFTGRLVLVEDPNLPIDYSMQYELVQDGDTLPVPNGFLSTPTFYRVIEVRDKNGKILSKGDFPEPGKIGLIDVYIGSRPGEDDLIEDNPSGYAHTYFIFGKADEARPR